MASTVAVSITIEALTNPTSNLISGVNIGVATYPDWTESTTLETTEYTISSEKVWTKTITGSTSGTPNGSFLFSLYIGNTSVATISEATLKTNGANWTKSDASAIRVAIIALFGEA